jgi:hypothetical protein
MSLFHALFLTVLLSAIMNYGECSDLNKDRMYINLKEPIPCIRRFNATHQIGCGKLDQAKYEGVVFAVRNQTELQLLTQLVDAHQAKFRYKLVIATVSSMYTAVVEYYKSSAQQSINGIVLSIAYDSATPFSEDLQSPNRAFSIYTDKTQVWNTPGSGYMFESFDVPFYLITSKNESDSIFTDCYDKFNYPLLVSDFDNIDFSKSMCGMQLGMEMSGAVSSTVCARRSNIQHTFDVNYFCDPLGGSNYFTFLSQKPSNEKPIVLVTARMDTFTQFEAYTPGANEPVSSIIGLLVLMDVLARNRDLMDAANVIFVMFDNDAFDYGGSSRFVHDLAVDRFPSFNVRLNQTHTREFKLSKENMTTLIELNQLGSIGMDALNKLYIHTDAITYEENEKVLVIIDDLVAKLTSSRPNFIIHFGIF